jgi:hypothetical protein
MSVEEFSFSSSSIASHSNSSQSSPLHQAMGSLGAHGESQASIFSKKETAGRLREMQSYLVRVIPTHESEQVLIEPEQDDI